MAQAVKRRPLSPPDVISLISQLEIQLGYLTDCHGFWRILRVDISSIKQSEGMIMVEGNFRCMEYARTVKEGKFRASLDERFDLIELSLTSSSEG